MRCVLALLLLTTIGAPSQASVTIVRPNGPGLFAQNSPDGDSPNWRCVDETVMDSRWFFNPMPTLEGTQVVADASTVKIDFYSIPPVEPSLGEQIESLTLHFASSMDPEGSPSQAHIEAAVAIGGSQYYGPSIQVAGLFINQSYTWTTHPGTGEPWSWSDLEQLQIGIRQNAGIATILYTSQVYLVVRSSGPVPARHVSWGKVKNAYRAP